jgi:hypothetical protein
VTGRVLPVLALAAIVAGGVGCITVDGTLEADGSANVSLTYAVPPGTTEVSQRYVLTAPGVTIQSLTVAPDHTVSARLHLDDPSALGNTNLFKDVKISRRTEGKDGVLAIEVTTIDKPVDNKKLPGPKINITLPGKVLEASEHAVVDGTHVHWEFTLADFLARKTWNLTTRYEAPAAPSGAAAPPATTSTTVPKAD